MYDDTRLEEDVLTWINSFKITEVYVHSFIELSNGVALYRILNLANDELWNIKELNLNDLNSSKFKLQNLANIFDGLATFYDDHLDLIVPDNYIDIEAISEFEVDSNGNLSLKLTLTLQTNILNY